MIRERLAKLNQKQQETIINTSSEVVPLIRTFENDLLSEVKSGQLSKLSIIGKEMDNGVNIQSLADNTKSRNKFLSIFFIFIMLFASAFAAYYFYSQKKVIITDVVEMKKYFIYDVWPETSKDSNLKSYTGEATSTTDNIVIDVLSFEKIYSYLIKNEDKFESLAKEKYKYTNLGDFQDATIENIDMRIADCNEGAIIYGYVGKEKLLISNDIGKYLKAYKSFKKI